MDHNSDLLRPSLSADHNSSAAVYSIRTAFFASFFGGPIAGAAIALIDSYKLRRLSVDWPLGLMAVGLFIVMGWLATHGGWRWLDAYLGRDSGVYGDRVINVIFFGVVYAFHRMYYKSMAVLGITPPNGLAAGIGAIVLGILAQWALLKLYLA
jgi:hypothetical protein